jgi:2-C-methyl-D-erythritol 4-phosphate cytidylyltransferase
MEGPSGLLRMKKTGAIIAAAGAGRRMKADRPKQFLAVEGIPILVLTLRKFDASPLIDHIVIASPHEAVDEVRHLAEQAGLSKPVTAIEGGERRQDSVAIAMKHLAAGTDLVAVHDGVRPFVSLEDIARVINEADRSGAAVLAVPVSDTIKEVERDVVKSTLRRERLVQAQTPQVFHIDVLTRAFDEALRDGYYGTDESSLVERMGHDVILVHGSEWNIKITRPSDLALARFLLEEERTPAR